MWKAVVSILTAWSLANLSLFPAFAGAETSGAVQQSAQAQQDPPAPQTDEPITVTVVGDILLDKNVGAQIERYGVDYPFAKTAELLKQADLTVGNLETAVSKRGSPEHKEFTFRAKPETLAGLANAGFDVVNLANNHTMDYGMDAFLDTMQHLRENDIAYVGGGGGVCPLYPDDQRKEGSNHRAEPCTAQSEVVCGEEQGGAGSRLFTGADARLCSQGCGRVRHHHCDHALEFGVQGLP